MAIHWQIKFKAFRSGTDYVVNIYDDNYSGSNPLLLDGAAQPFTTQEDDNEDMFMPVRTQSGYLRIVDNGKATQMVNGVETEVDFNWKDLLPSTDTDRPVTLTAGGTTLWQGFMQAQNFGGTLYGNPQEREFPVHCPLTVTEGTDINYNQTSIQNFAYLLERIISAIPNVCRPTRIMAQGGTYAQEWLLKRIDWQNFCETDNDGSIRARFNMFQCLEDLCRFWGWTARMHRQTLYLICADDAAQTNWLSLNISAGELGAMAAGYISGSTTGTFTSLTLAGDIFANTKNDDYLQRGANRASVDANCNSFNETIYESFPYSVIKRMEDGGWSGYTQYGDVSINYTNNILSFGDSFFSSSAVNGSGSFNLAIYSKNDNVNQDRVKVVRILKSYTGSPFISLDSVYEHLFDGYIQISGKIYQRGEQYQENRGIYNKTMRISIGIGKTRNNAQWFDGFSSWSSTKTIFPVLIGYSDGIIRFFSGILTTDLCSTVLAPKDGKLFIDFYGSSDLNEYDGQRLFDISDLQVKYKRLEYGGDYNPIERKTNIVYSSKNNNNVRMEWNADCIYASDNYNIFGFGTVINSNNSYLSTITYPDSQTPMHPEQHLANRVTNYWAASKRRLKIEPRSSILVSSTLIRDLSPQHKLTLDGTVCHPIAIGQEWGDDITIFTLLQI